MKKPAEVRVLCILSCLLLAHQVSAFSQTFGISPQDLKYYESATIWCRDGSTKFSKDRLNDNFCDCEDGTDEPGTSACPKGKFYCKNVGHSPLKIFSSRVNDGICDCCDGSDEYDGQVRCANTCWEAGKASRDKLVKKLNLYKDGIHIRRSEIESAKCLRQQQESKLTTLRKEVKTLSELVQKLRVEKDAIEERERQEEAAREKKMKEEADQRMKEEEAAGLVGKEESTADKQLEADVEEVKVGDLSEHEAIVGDDTDHNTEGERGLNTPESEEDKPEVHLTEIKEEPDLEKLSNEELGRVIASRWTGEDTTVHVPEDTVPKDTTDGDEDQEDVDQEHDYSEEDEYPAYKEDKHLSESVITHESVKSTWWERFVPGMLRSLFVRQPVDKSEAEQIRNQYSEETTKLSNMQNQISELETKLKEDFGPEGEFYSFYDKCFDLRVKKYVYKVCPYKQATQEEGHMTTRLGNWEGFKDNYSVLMFSHGDRCWNGPDRSLRVKLRCGTKSELRNVDEPSRCDYTAELVTPSFCLESRMQELQKKLEQLQSGIHEEL